MEVGEGLDGGDDGDCASLLIEVGRHREGAVGGRVVAAGGRRVARDHVGGEVRGARAESRVGG